MIQGAWTAIPPFLRPAFLSPLCGALFARGLPNGAAVQATLMASPAADLPHDAWQLVFTGRVTTRSPAVVLGPVALPPWRWLRWSIDYVGAPGLSTLTLTLCGDTLRSAQWPFSS